MTEHHFDAAPRRRRGIFLGLLLAISVIGSAGADKPSSTKNPNPHYFRVLNRGKDLSFYGTIDSLVPEELQVLLKANPDATIIHLNSPGGNVKEARRMSTLIAEAHIAAITDSYCYSACVIAFLGATERYMSPDASIGFHHESNKDASAAEIAESERRDQAYMASRGVPKDFLEKAFSTPASDIWTPTAKELTDAKVITGVRSDLTFAGYAGNSDEDEADDLLMSTLLYAPLKKAAPARFAAAKSKVADALHHNATYAAISALYDELADAAQNDFFLRASDDALIAFTREDIALLRTVVGENPAACSLKPRSDGGFNTHLEAHSDRDYERYDKAKAAAVADGAAHPVPVPNQMEIETARDALHLAFRAQHADEVEAMKDPASPKLAPGAGCRALADFLESALTLPKTEAANFLRYNYSTVPEPPAANSPAAGPSASRLPGASRSD